MRSSSGSFIKTWVKLSSQHHQHHQVLFSYSISARSGSMTMRVLITVGGEKLAQLGTNAMFGCLEGEESKGE